MDQRQTKQWLHFEYIINRDVLTHVTDDSELCQRVQNDKPDADVLTAFSHGTPRLAHELVRVQPDLYPVVQQREERGQREGGHEYSDEAKL